MFVADREADLLHQIIRIAGIEIPRCKWIAVSYHIKLKSSVQSVGIITSCNFGIRVQSTVNQELADPAVYALRLHSPDDSTFCVK